MAIAKVKTRKLELTPATIIQLAIALVLTVVSLVLLIVSIGKFRLKMAYSDALYNYDSNRPNVPEYCKTAIDRDKDYGWAREMLAKVLCDNGKLEDAETEYNVLAGSPFNRATVHCGLGVIWLKRADKATNPKEVADAAGKAKAEFTLAMSDAACPEAAIGLAHCDLVLALKAHDGAALDRAQKGFDKAKAMLDKPDIAANSTRDGLVDFYAGMGKIKSMGSAYSEEAAMYFKASYQYAPQEVLPLVNLVALEAQQYDQSKYSLEEFSRREQEINNFSGRIKEMWKGRRDYYTGLEEAWFQRELAVAELAWRSGNASRFDNMFYTLQTEFGSRVEHFIMRAAIKLKLAMEANSLQPVTDRMALAKTSLDDLLNVAALKDKDNLAFYVAALNNAAAIETWQSVNTPLGPQGLDNADRHLDEALKVAPDDPLVNRNYAIVLKKKGKGLDKIQPYLDKAKSCSDHAEVESYVQEK